MTDMERAVALTDKYEALPMLEELALAFAAVRSEALEQAALMAEAEFETEGLWSHDRYIGNRIARRIRSLAKGEGGGRW